MTESSDSPSSSSPFSSSMNNTASDKNSITPTNSKSPFTSTNNTLAKLAKSIVQNDCNDCVTGIKFTENLHCDPKKDDAEACLLSIENYIKSVLPPPPLLDSSSSNSTAVSTSTSAPYYLFPSVHSYLDRVSDIVSEHIYSIYIGAMLGASITAGMILGTYLSTSIFSRLSTLDFWNLTTSKFFFSQKPKHTHNVANDSNPSSTITYNKTDNVSCTQILPNKSILILSGTSTNFDNISTSLSPLLQYKECLDNLSISLSKNDLTWKNVVKITAYLKSISQKSGTVFNCCKEFKSIATVYTNSNIDMLNVIIVQSLENENCLIQVELMATR